MQSSITFRPPAIQAKPAHVVQQEISKIAALPSAPHLSLKATQISYVALCCVIQPSKKKDGAEKATLRRIKINGSQPEGEVDLDEEIENAIRLPNNSSDPKISQTTGDGEVAILISALKGFFYYLEAAGRKTKKRLTQHAFAVEILGSWGACDGCKARLSKFAALWANKAGSVLTEGESATLTITFTYTYPAQEFKKTGGWSTVYGWYEDGEKGPCTHVLNFAVQG